MRDNYRPPYAVFGQETLNTAEDLSCVILNRGGRYERAQVIRQLNELGFDSIISVEVGSNHYEIEGLCQVFPNLRVLVLQNNISLGEMVNLAMTEASSEYVMIIWNTFIHTLPSINLLRYIQDSDSICIVPQLLNHAADPIPGVHIPTQYRNELNIVSTTVQSAVRRTLYPTDFVGLYHRSSFLDCGGYDLNIREPYWQLVDFGFRAGLFGKRIVVDTRWQLNCRSPQMVEDRNEGVGYARFFLKNLAISFGRGGVYIPFLSCIKLCLGRRLSLITLLRIRRSLRAWLTVEQQKIICDATKFIQTWDDE